MHPYCERCERMGLLKPATVVHHKTYLTPENIKNPMYTIDADNLEALCVDCHAKEHHEKPQTGDGLQFDSEGNLIQTGGQTTEGQGGYT